MPHQLDVLVAQHIFNLETRSKVIALRNGTDVTAYDARATPNDPWRRVMGYCTDWSACGFVIAHLTKLGYDLQLEHEAGGWWAMFKHDGTPGIWADRYPLATIAICLAALRVFHIFAHWPES